MKKKILIFCLVMITSFSLIACGKKNESSNEDKIEQTEEIQQENLSREENLLEDENTTAVEEQEEVVVEEPEPQITYPVVVEETEENLERLKNIIYCRMYIQGNTAQGVNWSFVDKLEEFPFDKFLLFHWVDFYGEYFTQNMTKQEEIDKTISEFGTATMPKNIANQISQWYCGKDVVVDNVKVFDMPQSNEYKFALGAIGEHCMEEIIIDEIIQISEQEVEINGKIKFWEYFEEDDDKEDYFKLTAQINPESIFGGYTFEKMVFMDTKEEMEAYNKQEENSWQQIYTDFYLQQSRTVDRQADTSREFYVADANNDNIPELIEIEKYSYDTILDVKTYTIVENEVVEFENELYDFLQQMEYSAGIGYLTNLKCLYAEYEAQGGPVYYVGNATFKLHNNKLKTEEELFFSESFSSGRKEYKRNENVISEQEYKNIRESWDIVTLPFAVRDRATNEFLKVIKFCENLMSGKITSETNNQESENSTEYKLPNSNTTYLTVADLQGFTAEDCQIARNEIYARYGRKFLNETLQAYFDSCSWYVGTIEPEDFNEAVLNEYEVANRDLIVQYEADQGFN